MGEVTCWLVTHGEGKPGKLALAREKEDHAGLGLRCWACFCWAWQLSGPSLARRGWPNLGLKELGFGLLFGQKRRRPNEPC